MPDPRSSGSKRIGSDRLSGYIFGEMFLCSFPTFSYNEVRLDMFIIYDTVQCLFVAVGLKVGLRAWRDFNHLDLWKIQGGSNSICNIFSIKTNVTNFLKSFNPVLSSYLYPTLVGYHAYLIANKYQSILTGKPIFLRIRTHADLYIRSLEEKFKRTCIFWPADWIYTCLDLIYKFIYWSFTETSVSIREWLVQKPTNKPSMSHFFLPYHFGCFKSYTSF